MVQTQASRLRKVNEGVRRRPGLRAGLHTLITSRAVTVPLTIFVVTRLGIFFIAYLAAILLPASSDPPLYHLRPPDNILVDVFGSRWDTGFYVSIVEEGYQLEDVPLPSVAFFPFFPLSIFYIELRI